MRGVNPHAGGVQSSLKRWSRAPPSCNCTVRTSKNIGLCFLTTALPEQHPRTSMSVHVYITGTSTTTGQPFERDLNLTVVPLASSPAPCRSCHRTSSPFSVGSWSYESRVTQSGQRRALDRQRIIPAMQASRSPSVLKADGGPFQPSLILATLLQTFSLSTRR